MPHVRVGDVVTILNDTTRYDVTQVEGDMARLWPADPDDKRGGQWILTSLLRVVSA